MQELKLFTSESVSEGHPDKICDQISDAILDAVLKIDPQARVACECFITTQYVLVGGEIKTSANIDYEAIVRKTIKDIGYDDEAKGFNYASAKVDVKIHQQSPDIAVGVLNASDNKQELGAGDQGIMFGFATNETTSYMPLPIMIAHDLVKEATRLRKEGLFIGACPDMKSQVSINYSNPKPCVDTILMSIQHEDNIDDQAFKQYIKSNIIAPVLIKYEVDAHDYKVLLNPTGRFVIGGPHGDAGLTGRKIIVDTYGGFSRHGGGAFSGKDATKVDRSAAYAARYIAKNIVAAKLCDKCEIQLSYAIGVATPVSILVETFNTGYVSDEVILKAIRENFQLSPQGIIESLDLRRPIYQQTAAYGHMGREDLALPWEKLDKVEILKTYLD
ncbi:MAG: methionine adenosyltransferase [Bacilli bacterium]